VVVEPELLSFPTDYPIKVVGRSGTDLRVSIDAIMAKHVPDLEPHRISERLSGNGNFLSITYTIVASSREQVVALASELTQCPGVIMVI